MISWKKLAVGGAISIATIGSGSAYAYACNHRPPEHHRPPHHHQPTTTTTSTTEPPPTTTSSTIVG